MPSLPKGGEEVAIRYEFLVAKRAKEKTVSKGTKQRTFANAKRGGIKEGGQNKACEGKRR